VAGRSQEKNQRSRDRNLARKAQLRAEAESRNEHWNRLSPSNKLDALDYRLGQGIGATKQREKLYSQIGA
jgi:hypothetical protein